MSSDSFKVVLEHIPLGFARGKVVLSENRKPVDYLLCEVNQAFADLLGKKRENLLNRTLFQLFSTGEAEEILPLKKCTETALKGGTVDLEIFFSRTQKKHPVTIYSPQYGYFDILIQKGRVKNETDITDTSLIPRGVLKETSVGTGIEIKGIIREINHEFSRITGYSREELIGKRFSDLFPCFKDENNRCPQWSWDPNSFECSLKKKDGEEMKAVLAFSPLRPGDTGMGNIFSVRDLTETIQKKEERDKIYAMLTSLFENSPSPMSILNTRGEFELVSKVNAERMGLRAEEIKGKRIEEVMPSEKAEKFRENLERVIKTGKPHIQEYSLEVNEEERFYQAWRFPVKKTGNSVELVGTFSLDITERKKYEEKLKSLSYQDPLTGLWNRAFVEEELERMARDDRTDLCLIIVDINGLKLANDVYGYRTGDKILKRTAGILKNAAPENYILARWGGDEFLFILPETPPEKAEEFGEKITRLCCGESVEGLPLSISWGFSCGEGGESEFIEVLKEAEDRMFQNKLAESRSARSSILSAMLETLRAKSDETEEHARRMKEMAFQIGEALNLSTAEMDRLALLVSLHDIGKISISQEILNKPGKLNEEEWEKIKKHPETGYHIALSTGEFAHVAEEILAHHECWDGKGYPNGLKGKEIPLLSRILAIIDAFDVMTNGRPYKSRMSEDEAIDELKRCSGTQFDPELVDIFMDLAEIRVK